MKKGIFYSFITILLTALCIVSGTTYAYYSSINANDINIEAAKVDVKFKIANINEYFCKGLIPDPTNPNKYNFNYDSYPNYDTKTGTLTIIDNTLKFENISGLNWGDLKFQFEITSNSNVPVDVRIMSEYSGKTVEDDVYLINTDNYTPTFVNIAANDSEPHYLDAKLRLECVKSNNLEISYSAYTVISGENKYINMLPSAEEIFDVPEDFYGEHIIDVPTGMDPKLSQEIGHNEPYHVNLIKISDLLFIGDIWSSFHFTKKYFKVYDKQNHVIGEVDRTEDPSKIKIEPIDFSKYNLNAKMKPFGFRLSVSNLMTEIDTNPTFKVRFNLKTDLGYKSLGDYEESINYPIISHINSFCSYNKDENNEIIKTDYKTPIILNDYKYIITISSLDSNEYLTDDINYVPLFEIVFVNKYDMIGAR